MATEVTAAILLHEGKVLVAKRGPGGPTGGMWELPGGKVEIGETPEECLEREMLEEFGINVTVGRFFGESVFHYHNGAIKLLAYLTSWESGELVPAVHADYCWVSVDELKDYELAPADIPLAEKLAEELLL
jgi:8-oxo-dGTP diphosphatase